MVEPVLNESDGASENSDDPHMLESEEDQPLRNSLRKDETGSINDALKHKSQLDFSAKMEEIDLAHQQPSCSPLTGADSGLGNTMKRSYPPRRKVSAVRDFPPFTGHAPRRSHEQVKELFSAENENLDTEKSVIKGVAEVGYEKQRRIDTQEGRPEPVKLMKFEEKYAQKKSEKYGCGDDAYGASNRTEVRREDMIKKIMVYQGSRNLGKEVSGLPGSTNQSQSGKVVVKPLKAVSRKAERQISKPEGKEIVLGCPVKIKNRYSGEISDQTRGLPGSTKQLQSEKAKRKAETQVSRREGKEIVLGCPAKSSEFSVRTRGQRKSFPSRKEIKFQ